MPLYLGTEKIGGTASILVGSAGVSLQEKAITPSEVEQIVIADAGFDGLSKVTVNPIPDAYQNVTSVTAKAANVLDGDVFVDATGAEIEGTMPNNGAIFSTLDVSNASYTVPKGYHNGTGSVSISLETKAVTPSKDSQTVTPTSGQVLSKVTVNPIPAQYITTTDATASASDIVSGASAYVNGTKVTGTLVIQHYYTGSTEPSASLGVDGDIYVKA